MAADGTRKPSYQDGPEAAKRFDDAMDRILRVSKTDLTKREAEYQRSRPRKSRRRRTR